MKSSSLISSAQNTLLLPIELDNHRINYDKVLKMKPKLKIDCVASTFTLTLNIPGFKNEDISVFAGKGKIAVKAVDQTRLNNLNICKVYKAEYTLPSGVLMDKLRKSYQNEILCIRGEIEKVAACTK